jgi:hypothetical protein
MRWWIVADMDNDSYITCFNVADTQECIRYWGYLKIKDRKSILKQTDIWSFVNSFRFSLHIRDENIIQKILNTEYKDIDLMKLQRALIKFNLGEHLI